MQFVEEGDAVKLLNCDTPRCPPVGPTLHYLVLSYIKEHKYEIENISYITQN